MSQDRNDLGLEAGTRQPVFAGCRVGPRHPRESFRDRQVPAYLRVVMWTCGLAVAAGCTNANTPPIAKPPKAAASPKAEVAVTPVASQVDAKDAAESAPLPAVTSDHKPAPSTTPEQDSQPEELSSPERLAILTPGGPLLVDARLTINGQPHAKAFDSIVKRVLDASDTDHDGRSTWKELTADRVYFEKEMQNAPAVGSRQMKTLIERYDENRDGQIQPAEAAGWLGRDAGTSAKALAVRSTRAYRPVARATSQVWHLIDGDRNGGLSSDEIDAAPDRLLSLDADDDRILAPPEMASLREQLEAAGQRQMNVGREASHYAVIYLEPDVEIERLHYLLSDLYAPQQDLGPASFSDLGGLFKILDANGDDWLERDELASMLSVDPHVQLTVAFNRDAKVEKGSATIEVKTLSPVATVAAQPSADRAVISMGNTRLILSAHNLSTAASDEQTAAQAAAQNQIRFMVHDRCDALFEELDANADGRLGEREIAYCPARLAERDRNGDGQLAGDEFPYSMIVALLLAEQPSEQSFYIPPSAAISAANSDKPLPAWFSHADLNGDGDISRREFLGSIEQFNRLDVDQDGYISAAEAGTAL
ncbi:MAG: hypothetical protein L0228_12225 [Planctomycetes bacterium]|nr:hypothetical protein [Planctomycetota bacterium]